MSEEEKEAIEELKKFSNLIIEGGIPNSLIVNKLKITFNLIDKLQKENETLHHDLEVYKNRETNAQKACGKLSTLNKKFRKRLNKLQKEYEDMREELQMYVDTDVMKLREENEELKEEIENWKFTHKYVEENYIHKDKIRGKIKELEEYRKKHFYYQKELSKAKHDKSMKMYGAIEVLKELLGDDEQ